MTKSKRGGRRPGAGAPKGNLNALKHGRRSRQFAQLGALLAANPTTRQALLELARRHFDKQIKAEEAAATILSRLYEHAHDIARGIDSPGPFQDLLGLNVQSRYPNAAQSSGRAAHRRSANTRRTAQRENHRPVNQPSDANQEINLPPDTKRGAQPHD